jgi:uncharacterized protein
VTLKRLVLSAPLRLVWVVLLLFGANALLDRLGIAPAPAGGASDSLAWVYRNAAVALLLLWVAVRFLEGKRLADVGLGLRQAPRGLGLGFALGAGMLSAVMGLLALLGHYRVLGWATLPPGLSRPLFLLVATAALLCVGISEEVKMRGLLFRLLEQSLGTWLAIGLSALLFGFGHWRNPGATTWSSLAIALEGGVLFAALYKATGSLWVPIGLHWGWNLFEGPVWGAAVSGHSLSVLLQGALSGPALLTGGPFGPEAGLPVLFLGGGLGALALLRMSRLGKTVPPPWAPLHKGPVRLEAVPDPEPGTPR